MSVASLHVWMKYDDPCRHHAEENVLGYSSLYREVGTTCSLQADLTNIPTSGQLSTQMSTQIGVLIRLVLAPKTHSQKLEQAQTTFKLSG